MASTNDFTPQVLYEPLEGVERLENYRPGGYHPVKISDQFHGRYRIIHKLGYGSYSTVWLARHEQFMKYVAVKVCTADTNPQDIGILSILNDPKRSTVKSPGETMIPLIMDKFSIQGPNGNHDCYVSVLARDSLGKASEKISAEEARILLTDFGEAFSPSPSQELSLSFPSDIWTLACFIWAIIVQRPLVKGFLATPDDMTCEHVDALGILPPK